MNNMKEGQNKNEKVLQCYNANRYFSTKKKHKLKVYNTNHNTQKLKPEVEMK